MSTPVPTTISQLLRDLPLSDGLDRDARVSRPSYERNFSFASRKRMNPPDLSMMVPTTSNFSPP